MLETARNLFQCRLCWRVTFAVFALIMAIEGVILVPSAARFKQVELERLAHEAQIMIEPILVGLGEALDDSAALKQRVGYRAQDHYIDAVAVYRPKGVLLSSMGDAPTPNLPAGVAMPGHMVQIVPDSTDESRIKVAWSSGAPGLPVVVARIDARGVSNKLVAYLFRIGGLIILIVLVVTAGTMLVVYRWVLQPLPQLRASALAAGAEPDRAESFAVAQRRPDELGELIVAHNAMLERVAASKQRDREVAEERTRFLTRHDALTGLPNRAALIEFVDGLARQPAASERCVALLLVELQQLSVLSAAFGESGFDELLRRIADRLRQTAPLHGFVGCLGAGRFAVTHTDAEFSAPRIANLAETLLRELSDCAGLGSVAFRIGIAHAEGETPKGRAMLDEAELALARTTSSEGVRYLFYSRQLTEEAHDRQTLARDLERAIGAGELFPVFQPKVALRPEGGTALAGAEVLLRWKHATRGMVRPDLFVALAESIGLIVPLGDQVLRGAARAARGWLERRGWSPSLAVNLSARQFADPALVDQVKNVLESERIESRFLELEITETAAMKDAALTASVLESLRALGVRVSIDDFGTGYSSLSYLRRFAVDAIKIDKSLVDDIGADPNAEAVCDAILRMGKSLGTKIVAEGVENVRQLEFLRLRRCDEVQGYLFSKPLALEEFERSWVALRKAS